MTGDIRRLREVYAPPHTGSGTHRIQVIAWQSVLLTGLRHGDLAQRCLRGISVWRDGLKPVIYLFLSMKLAFFMDIEV